MTEPDLPAAGWYVDIPADAARNQQHYWDGIRWTGATRIPASPDAAVPSQVHAAPGESGELAGLRSRVDGCLIDLVVVAFLAPVTGRGIALLTEYADTSESAWPFVDGLPALLSLSAAVMYFLIVQAHGRRTLGKSVVGTLVVDAATRHPISASKSVARATSMTLSALPLGLGFWWAAWDTNHQTWHDKIARTIVIQTRADTRALMAHHGFGASH